MRDLVHCQGDPAHGGAQVHFTPQVNQGCGGIAHQAGRKDDRTSHAAGEPYLLFTSSALALGQVKFPNDFKTPTLNL